MLYFAITQEKVRDDSKENKMITLPEMLWVARGYKRTVDNTESKLAYMTFVEKTKAGEESASFLKRKATGIRWAQATVSKDNVLEEADFILNYTKLQAEHIEPYPYYYKYHVYETYTRSKGT